MTTAERVRAARTPNEAMLAIAEGLDQLLELLPAALKQVTEAQANPVWWIPPADEPYLSDDAKHATVLRERAIEAESKGVRVELKGDTAEVVIPPPSEERMAARRMLEQQRLKLAEAHPEIFGPEHDWTEMYAKGGPLWLYNLIGGREIVMEYDVEVRRAMVQDVEQDDVAEANNMGRDLLKQASIQPNDEGIGAMHVSNL